MKSSLLIAIFTIILGTTLFTQSLTTDNKSLFAHRDGCHRWHSCPSDTGSYVCGDLGYDDECPKKSKSKKSDSDKTKSKSKNKKSSTDKTSKDKETKKSDNDKDDGASKNEATQSNIEIPNSTTTVATPYVADSSITSREGIELAGPITEVIDGDTVDISGSVRIRLALVNTPEVGQMGFDSAKKFVDDLCLFKNGEVDMDEGQRQGSFGREIGVLYCEGVNVNQALMNNSLATISTEFCDVSEFAVEVWAASYCSGSYDASTELSPSVENISTTQASSSSFTKSIGPSETDYPSDLSRCPNGSHRSPSGDCEKVTNTIGLPRCPNGYHRGPDGDCERVS
jgi:micrococcal nuclease